MNENRCIHEFLVNECGSCKAPPDGINEIVYKTSGGLAFHNWPDCAFLREGQFIAEQRDQIIHPITPIKWSYVFYEFGACEWCCALHHKRKMNLPSCEAYIDQKWEKCQLIRSRETKNFEKEYQVLLQKSNFIYIVTEDSIKFPSSTNSTVNELI